MSTYTQILFQIIFGTKWNKQTLSKTNRDQLYRYIHGLITNKHCHLYIVNGVENHLHIVTHLHPTVALASLIKDIKLATSGFIKENKLFPNFEGWQVGYSAFTYNYSMKSQLIAYVKNQEEHHKKFSFKEELIQILGEHDVEFDEKYLAS